MATKVFVHENVPDRSLFLDGLRSDVSVLEFDAIAVDAMRVGFVWENSRIMRTIPFGSNVHPEFTWFSQEIIDFFHLNSSLTIDLITCNLGENVEFLEELERIKILFPLIVFHYSLDETGNREGNWIMESSGLDIKPIYFTEGIDEWKHTLMLSFANIIYNKKPITFYSPGTIKGISNSGYTGTDISNVITVCANISAYAALKSNGSVVTWGDSIRGGDSSNVSLSNVKKLFYTYGAFAALKNDGSVVTWGQGAGGNSLSVSGNLMSGVVNIFSNQVAFAALKSNGSVVTWGNPNNGGSSSSVSNNLLSGVIKIVSTYTAFAALKSDGTVVTWGSASMGGDSSGVSLNLTNVTNIFATVDSFAALKSNGSVITWGDQSAGGNSSSVSSDLTSNVVDIIGTYSGFSAFKSDGSVISWGSVVDFSTAVRSSISSDVISVIGNVGAFAALKQNGSVVTWGGAGYGGDSSTVSSDLSSNVVKIFNNGTTFAALKSNGSVVTWLPTNTNGGNSNSVSLTSNVINIFSSSNAFAAVKSDGSVATWGNTVYGGIASGQNITYLFEGDSNFVHISTPSQIPLVPYFMAKSDGSINILQTDYNIANITSYQYKFTHDSDNWININQYTRNITGLSVSTTYNLYLRAINSIAPGDNNSFLVKTNSSGQLKINVYVTTTILASIPSQSSITSLIISPTSFNYAQRTGTVTLTLGSTSSLTSSSILNNFQINPSNSGSISNVTIDSSSNQISISGQMIPPPTNFTSNTLTVTGQTGSNVFKNGTYIASSSSSFSSSYLAYKAFNGPTGTFWHCGYSGNNGYTQMPYNPSYIGGGSGATYYSTTIDSVSYPGEWIQIQFPFQFFLSSYSLYPSEGNLNKSFKLFYIAGSNNGTTWNMVNIQNLSSQPSTLLTTFTVTTNNSYSYYRLIINKTFGDNVAELNQWNLFANSQSVTTATFTANTNMNTNCTITASGDIYSNSVTTSPFSINTITPTPMSISTPNLTYLNPSGQLRLMFATTLLADLSLNNFTSSDLTFSNFTKTNSTTYDLSVNLSTEFTGTKRIVYSYFDTIQNIDISCSTLKPRISSSTPFSDPLLTSALRTNTIQLQLNRNVIGDLNASYFTNIDSNISVLSVSKVTDLCYNIVVSTTGDYLSSKKFTYSHLGITSDISFNVDTQDTRITPTINKLSFVNVNKTIGYSSATLINPTTDSTGVWSYTSSNPSVVTVSGSIVTILSIGVSTITATLASTTNYKPYTNTDITMQFTVRDRDTPSIGSFEIPDQLLSSQTYTIQNPTKPLDHSGSWVYSSANDSIVTISGNIIHLNRKGIVKITASLSQNEDYKSISLNTKLFITSVAADPSSNFTFINTDTIANAFTSTVLNNIPVSSGSATISSSVLTSANVQTTQVLGGNSEQKQANRDLLIDTLFNVLDPSVKSVEIPKEFIYVPPQIPPSVSSVKVFTSEGSTASQPLTIDSSNIPQNQALFCPLKTDTEVMKLNGSGVFQNDTITIQRSIGDTYSATTYDSVLHNTVTKVYNKGDFIIFAGLVIVLGSITVSNFPYPLSNICFPAGEMVLTDSGYKPIERVKKGIDTIRGETIVEVTATRTHDKTLVQIEKNAIIAGVPNKRTLVSNNHKLRFKGKMVTASQLVGRRGVISVPYSGQPLYNILLEKGSKMIVNGMIAETLSPKNNIALLYEYLNESKNIALIESYNQTYKKSK